MENRISIAIATYEMYGKGAFFIKRCIDSIINQTYTNIEIVISDHSIDDEIKNVCNDYDFDIKYIRNDKLRGSSSANFNNSIINSTGDYIKILCQDDCLYDSKSIELTVKKLDESNKKWLVSPYYHTSDMINIKNLHHPKVFSDYSPIFNLIGTHSCLTIRKDVNLLFDNNLIWFMDCEYYSRLYKKYSYPDYLSVPTMIQSVWDGQVTNKLVDGNLITKETNYIKNKNKI
jgi:glycosyltransferase involved in cell wall biosynthesis